MNTYEPISEFTDLNQNNNYFNYNNNFIENSIIKSLKINEFSGLIDKTYENLSLYENLLINYKKNKNNKEQSVNFIKNKNLIILKQNIKIILQLHNINIYKFKKNIVYFKFINIFEKQKYLINKLNKFKVKKNVNINIMYFIGKFYFFIFFIIFIITYFKNKLSIGKIIKILCYNLLITTVIVKNIL
jgi:hypothetical protein